MYNFQGIWFKILRKDCLLNFAINRFFKNINSSKCYTFNINNSQYLMTLAIPAPSVPLCINYVDTWYENLWWWTWSLLWFVMISMNSVKWIWRWFLLSQPKSTFTIMKDFKCNEHRQQVSGQKRLIHCWHFILASAFSIMKILV